MILPNHAFWQVWRPTRFVFIVAGIAFLLGFGATLGAIGALRLMGWMLVRWGCP